MVSITNEARRTFMLFISMFPDRLLLRVVFWLQHIGLFDVYAGSDRFGHPIG